MKMSTLLAREFIVKNQTNAMRSPADSKQDFATGSLHLGPEPASQSISVPAPGPMWSLTPLETQKEVMGTLKRHWSQCARTLGDRALCPSPNGQKTPHKAHGLLEGLSPPVYKMGLRMPPLLCDKICWRAKEITCLCKSFENYKIQHHCMVASDGVCFLKGK